jgi:formylglycine-generating enzyme required for sulfatase activity
MTHLDRVALLVGLMTAACALGCSRADDGGAARDAGVDAALTNDGSGGDATRLDGASNDAGGDAAPGDGAAADQGPTDGPDPATVTWVSIPGGTFAMGCSVGDTRCESKELPRHDVTLAPFELMATEITQTQYRAVTGTNPSLHPDCSDCPVDTINWQMAKDFCAAVGGRLPSEAEWEYAARAGTTTSYICGENPACLDSVSWNVDNSLVGSYYRTHPVGTKVANDFGLYDMLGNVWEWVEDCWHDDYTNAPVDGGAWVDGAGADCTVRVMRGSSYLYNSGDFFMRSSYRESYGADAWFGSLGARCAR